MNQSESAPAAQPSGLRQLGWVALCLVVSLGFLFWDGFLPGRTVSSIDTPLGVISSQCEALPGGFSAVWQDLYWLGGADPSAPLDISQGLALVAGNLVFSKIYAPFALLFLGLSAWLCFRQWKLSPLACMLGGIAAALNSNFFSTACWGVASHPLSFGLDFLALAALADESSPRQWVRVAVAGFAVGMAVMEAFDIGAIFSLVVAGFVVFQALAGPGTGSQRIGRGFRRLTLVAVCAGLIAAHTVAILVGTQIKGVAGMGQDAASKAQRWDEATQWSLPKAEILSLIVPGLFGYRMDTPRGLAESLQDYYKGGNYWGACGRDAAWDRYFASGRKGPPPQGFIRFGGGGLYTGVLVVLIALWAVSQTLRGEASVFGLAERKFILFWSGVALICMLLAFGRFAPFYQVFYALPFASTMRNPSKFIHVVEWILVILFAYGVHGLSRTRLETPTAARRGLSAQLRSWWAKAATFDKNWVRGSVIALGASVVAWLIYWGSRERVMAYLQEVQFDSEMAGLIADFSIQQAACFLVLLVLALSLVILVMSGYFGGRRTRSCGILLGVLLVLDLGWANIPWVITWNWVQKYATNPVIDFLARKPYEHRVAVLPFNPPPQYALLRKLYHGEWMQHLFSYNNIQSLDVLQNPRPQEDQIAFETALFFDRSTNKMHLVTRRWQLTNTRYLLGPAGYLDVLNRQIDPVQHRFRIAAMFDIAGKPGIPNPIGYDELTAVMNTNGPYAVFDFTGALPRARLYANWQVSTNDQTTLTELASVAFNPERTVLVADALPAPRPSSVTNQNGGMVKFVSYAPKQIVLHAEALRPAVLLLNDRYNHDWKVSVDGKPEKVLRCNYLMRGVYLQRGSHTVEFRFAPPVGTLYVSLAAVAVSVLLLGYLAVSRGNQPIVPPPDAAPSAK